MYSYEVHNQISAVCVRVAEIWWNQSSHSNSGQMSQIFEVEDWSLSACYQAPLAIYY